MDLSIQLRRLTRPARLGAAAVLFTLAVVAVDGWWNDVRARSASSHPPRLRAASIPRAGDRVVVFAPHPDDETLGVGGLIYQARKNGADVRVVLFTSGDGFPLCAVHQFHSQPGPVEMRRLGRDRRTELLAAVGRLGVPADHVSFLGYPDRGLATLWLDRWKPATAYTSPFTSLSHVSGQASFHPGAPYCGQAVLSDVEALLERFRPDYVFAPDPADDHPDHWVAHCFVRLALERLRSRAWASHAVCRTYLIHRGEWPAPRGCNPSLFLLPPAALTQLDVQWETATLSAEAVRAKRYALRAHRSQEATCGSFLDAFVRRNEILGSWNTEAAHALLPASSTPPRQVVRDDAGGTQSHVTVSAGSPEPVQTALVGPQPPGPYGSGVVTVTESTRDRWGRDRCGAVDFSSLVIQPTPSAIRLSAELRDPVASWPIYYLYWKPVDGPVGSIRTHVYRFTDFRCEPPHTRHSVRDRELTVEVPRSELGGAESIMVGASVWKGGIQLDSTPWRVVQLGHAPEVPAGPNRTL